jgi:hypothetical protein
VTSLEIAQRSKEIYPSKIRPQGFCKVELAVSALPKKEAAEALLARGADQ